MQALKMTSIPALNLKLHICFLPKLIFTIGATDAEILKVWTSVAKLRYTMALYASLGGGERNPVYPLTLKRITLVLLRPTLPSLSPLRLKRDRVSSCLELPMWAVKYMQWKCVWGCPICPTTVAMLKISIALQSVLFNVE